MPKASTRARLLAAARELVAAGDGRLPSAGAVAARAGVSRLTVYQHFGSHAGLMVALAETARRAAGLATEGAPAERVRGLIRARCERWAGDPGLFRRLPAATESDPGPIHELALALSAADRLRPGCSIREAEDVIAIATSFAAFDQLHQDGRRSIAAVAEILNRIAATVLSYA